MAKAKNTRETPEKYPWIAEPLRRLAVAVEFLKHDPANARTHDAANLASIEASLRQFGQVSPLVVNANNSQVVIGNGRLAVIRDRLGWSHAAAISRPMTVAQQRALSIADNRTAELASWDDALLERALSAMRTSDAELFEALRLADLEDAIDELAAGGEGEGGGGGDPPAFEVVVACEDEADQDALCGKLSRMGRQCRKLTTHWDGAAPA